MANRIRLKGTTEETFSIALSDGAFTPNKTMEGVILSTNYEAVPNTIFLETTNGIGTDNGIWIGKGTDAGRLHFGGNGSAAPAQIQVTSGTFSLLAMTGWSATGTNGGNIVWIGGDAESASNGNGGNATISAGNGEGSGDGGNVNIYAGSPNGSGDVGDVNIEARNVDLTILNELQINTDPGTSGQVLTSQGTGSPPIWSTVSGGPPGYETAVATAAQTVFNTTVATVANGGGSAYLQVFRNGVKQIEGASKHYTVTGANQITFNTGLTLNDDVEFYAF